MISEQHHTSEANGRARHRTSVIAILNQKGGAGKTTTAVNLSAALAMMGKKVLVVDVDPQGHATVHLGLRPGELQRSLSDLFMKLDFPVEEIILPVTDNLAILPANIHLSAAERDLLHRLGRDQILQRRLEPLRKNYDYILLDCPPSLGMLSLNALCASDELIVPVAADYFALDGMTHLIETVEAVRTHLSRPIVVAGILITQYDNRKTLAREVRAAAGQYRLPIFDTVIRDNVKLAEAPWRGVDIYRYDASATGAEDYRQLAKEYLKEFANGY